MITWPDIAFEPINVWSTSMNNDSLRFGLQTEIWNDSIAVRIGKGTKGTGAFQVATSIEFLDVEPGLYTAPVMHLSNSEAQELADQLYACGISPSKLAGSTGQLAAVTYHLEDMRKLVFK